MSMELNSNATDYRLKVLSFNTWGPPVVSKKPKERTLALIQAFSDRNEEFDIIGFQEMFLPWVKEMMIEGMNNAGYPYIHHFKAGPSMPACASGSGLLIASKYPIVDTAFHGYTMNGKPLHLAHWDYQTSKGVGLARVFTPAGLVDVYVTHLVAQYADFDRDGYARQRAAQACECAEFIRMTRQSELSVLLGDLNSLPDQLPAQIIRELGSLNDAYEDSIIVQSRLKAGYTTANIDSLTNPYIGATTITGAYTHKREVLKVDLAEQADATARTEREQQGANTQIVGQKSKRRSRLDPTYGTVDNYWSNPAGKSNTPRCDEDARLDYVMYSIAGTYSGLVHTLSAAQSDPSRQRRKGDTLVSTPSAQPDSQEAKLSRESVEEVEVSSPDQAHDLTTGHAVARSGKSVPQGPSANVMGLSTPGPVPRPSRSTSLSPTVDSPTPVADTPVALTASSPGWHLHGSRLEFKEKFRPMDPDSGLQSKEGEAMNYSDHFAVCAEFVYHYHPDQCRGTIGHPNTAMHVWHATLQASGDPNAAVGMGTLGGMIGDGLPEAMGSDELGQLASPLPAGRNKMDFARSTVATSSATSSANISRTSSLSDLGGGLISPTDRQQAGDDHTANLPVALGDPHQPLAHGLLSAANFTVTALPHPPQSWGTRRQLETLRKRVALILRCEQVVGEGLERTQAWRHGELAIAFGSIFLSLLLSLLLHNVGSGVSAPVTNLMAWIFTTFFVVGYLVILVLYRQDVFIWSTFITMCVFLVTFFLYLLVEGGLVAVIASVANSLLVIAVANAGLAVGPTSREMHGFEATSTSVTRILRQEQSRLKIVASAYARARGPLRIQVNKKTGEE